MAVNGINNPVITSKMYAKPEMAKKSTPKPEAKCTTCEYSGNITGAFYPHVQRLTPEKRFDFELATGTKLKDGSTLIKPVILSLGDVRINSTEDGKYTVKTGVSDKVLTLTEEELVNTKWLSRGKIKQVDENAYHMIYTDIEGESHAVKATKKGAMILLVENVCHL